MPFLGAYEAFMVENAAQISSLESGLRSLSYFLPGRFTDADLASEGVFSFVNLISLYNNRILYQAATRGNVPIKQSPHNRYTRDMLSKSRLLSLLAGLLSVVTLTENFVEMAVAKRTKQHPKQRWNVVLVIELVKAIAKLIVLLKTTRTVLHPLLPERDVDPETLQLAATTADTTAPGGDPVVFGHRRGKHSGKLMPSLDVFGQSGANLQQLVQSGDGVDATAQYLVSKALASAVKQPRDLLSVLRHARLLGETLFISRPVLYVLLVRKWGRQTWLPWLASLAIEVASWTLYTGKLEAAVAEWQHGPYLAPMHARTPLERAEHRRRLSLMFLNLLKDPFYNQFSKYFFVANRTLLAQC
ncbi:hypothetical protein RI367_005906 [Sorochytrium milnesiophthora]